MIVWGVVLMSASIESNDVAQSFWHVVNLPFHEAGHVVFRAFGEDHAFTGRQPGPAAHACNLFLGIPVKDKGSVCCILFHMVAW